MPLPEILGRLLLVQTTMDVMPSVEEMGGFLGAMLGEMPGVTGAWLELVPWSETSAPSPHLPRSALAPLSGMVAGRNLLPLRSLTHCYGALVIEVVEPEALRPYLPFLINLVNQVARLLETRRMVDLLNQTNARLRAEMEERHLVEIALQAANQELEAFAFSVSHDLRAPLRAISGFSQALMEDYGDQLQGEAQTYLRMLQESSQEMGRLIDGLLQLSRVTRGEMRQEIVNLSGLADKVVASLRQAEPDRRVMVEIAPHLVVHGNAQLLMVAMENLLGNAWKYTGKTPQAEISLGSVLQEGNTVYAVRDNGAGFDMTYRDKLFIPFQRLHRSDEFPGNGIGLATVQRIICRHGGSLWAQAEVGKGATFFFTLPERGV
ncbi:MAG: hypothetical protein HQL87_00890 [Magnetococcales bacterium]|nr:hypothetical protein [Magnetococcales bacterium]